MCNKRMRNTHASSACARVRKPLGGCRGGVSIHSFVPNTRTLYAAMWKWNVAPLPCPPAKSWYALAVANDGWMNAFGAYGASYL